MIPEPGRIRPYDPVGSDFGFPASADRPSPVTSPDLGLGVEPASSANDGKWRNPYVAAWPQRTVPPVNGSPPVGAYMAWLNRPPLGAEATGSIQSR
jgi:hypothetical protein